MLSRFPLAVAVLLFTVCGSFSFAAVPGDNSVCEGELSAKSAAAAIAELATAVDQFGIYVPEPYVFAAEDIIAAYHRSANPGQAELSDLVRGLNEIYNQVIQHPRNAGQFKSQRLMSVNFQGFERLISSKNPDVFPSAIRLLFFSAAVRDKNLTNEDGFNQMVNADTLFERIARGDFRTDNLAMPAAVPTGNLDSDQLRVRLAEIVTEQKLIEGIHLKSESLPIEIQELIKFIASPEGQEAPEANKLNRIKDTAAAIKQATGVNWRLDKIQESLVGYDERDLQDLVLRDNLSRIMPESDLARWVTLGTELKSLSTSVANFKN